MKTKFLELDSIPQKTVIPQVQDVFMDREKEVS